MRLSLRRMRSDFCCTALSYELSARNGGSVVETMYRAFSPGFCGTVTWAFGPGWYVPGPSALAVSDGLFAVCGGFGCG
jgi:hypothetical protein